MIILRGSSDILGREIIQVWMGLYSFRNMRLLEQLLLQLVLHGLSFGAFSFFVELAGWDLDTDFEGFFGFF